MRVRVRNALSIYNQVTSVGNVSENGCLAWQESWHTPSYTLISPYPYIFHEKLENMPNPHTHTPLFIYRLDDADGTREMASGQIKKSVLTRAPAGAVRDGRWVRGSNPGKIFFFQFVTDKLYGKTIFLPARPHKREKMEADANPGRLSFHANRLHCEFVHQGVVRVVVARCQ